MSPSISSKIHMNKNVNIHSQKYSLKVGSSFMYLCEVL